MTDVNWAPEPDLVVTTGIDSWLWAWDIREPRKPVFGFSAFNGKFPFRMLGKNIKRLTPSAAGGTQVKWNRRDANILASAHASEVLIWDRRVCLVGVL